MRKTKKIVSLMLCCIMLFGMTLSANAAGLPPTNAGPCPVCHTGIGALKSTSLCPGLDMRGLYRCKSCDAAFYFCSGHGITH